jgi:hypothetical protein
MVGASESEPRKRSGNHRGPARLLRGLLAAVLVAGAAACDSGDTPTNPIDPTPPEIITETFTGVVGQNGAVTFTFTTKAAGQVTARLTAVDPDDTIALGVSLGEWNGLTCEIKVTNDNTLEGAGVAGNVSGVGILCLRVFDAGKIPNPNPDPMRLAFEVILTHP